MNPANQLSAWLKSRDQKKCHRQLLIISGNKEWVAKSISPIVDLTNEESLWVGSPHANIESIKVKDYRTKLGQEHNYVILDCFEGFRANAAMALSGTVKAEGLMVLLCPDFLEWQTFDDPENINRISFGFQNTNLKSSFFEYLTTAFVNTSSVAILTSQYFRSPLSLVNNELDGSEFEEQETVIQLIRKHALGRANRPLILTADRGRGKSSALGIASAKLMENNSITIWVTAPHRANTEQIFHHAKRILPDNIKHTKNALNSSTSSLTYKPVDQLLMNTDIADVLLVDEAAAIPVHILMKLLDKFPRIIFSSTKDGYEGSGRGFSLKFSKLLDKTKPNYKNTLLKQPIRWYKHDVLESFWFDVMFYNDQVAKATPIKKSEITFRKVEKAELLRNSDLLRRIFKLLLDAHYQTSPDDLQRLLDSPEQTCFILTKEDNIIGVAQIIEEGGERLDDIKSDIANCSRRVKGHLVTQQLASLYNIAELCSLRQWRISRIVICPNFQQKGFGQTLLKHIEQEAENNRINYVSAAFGANESILKFWIKAKFNIAHIGQKPEVSSGEHSCICIKTLTNSNVTNITTKLLSDFSDELRFHLNKGLKSLPTELALLLLKTSQIKKQNYNEDKINQFIKGQRPLYSCHRDIFLALSKWICHKDLKNEVELLFLTALYFQNKSYEQLSAEFNLTGRKQIEQQIKLAITNLI